jgi:hypothetical protein
MSENKGNKGKSLIEYLLILIIVIIGMYFLVGTNLGSKKHDGHYGYQVTNLNCNC